MRDGILQVTVNISTIEELDLLKPFLQTGAATLATPTPPTQAAPDLKDDKPKSRKRSTPVPKAEKNEMTTTKVDEPQPLEEAEKQAQKLPTNLPTAPSQEAQELTTNLPDDVAFDSSTVVDELGSPITNFDEQVVPMLKRLLNDGYNKDPNNFRKFLQTELGIERATDIKNMPARFPEAYVKAKRTLDQLLNKDLGI